MEQLSKIIPILATSFFHGRRHQGERISFDPSENLENSTYKGDKFEMRSSYSVYLPTMPSSGVVSQYPIGVSRFSFLLIRVFQNLLTKDVKKAHTPCVQYRKN